MKTVVIRQELPVRSDWYVARLPQAFPGTAFRAAYSLDDAMALAPGAEVSIGIGPKITPALVAAMPWLEWLTSLTTGVDNLLTMAAFPRGVPISNVTGVQVPQMSELALTMMTALARRLPEVVRAQAGGCGTAGRSRCCMARRCACWASAASPRRWRCALRRWACG